MTLGKLTPDLGSPGACAAVQVGRMIELHDTFDGTFPFAPHTFDGHGFAQHDVDEGPVTVRGSSASTANPRGATSTGT